MTVDEIKTALNKAGLEVEDEARLPNNTGVQLRLKNGSIVNCFDTGTHTVQGRNQEVVNSAWGTPQLPSPLRLRLRQAIRSLSFMATIHQLEQNWRQCCGDGA